MDISIVIATKGRVKLLEQLLNSLCETRNSFKGLSEIILIDDSNVNDKNEIKNLCKKYDARLVDGASSVSTKRNQGGRLAKGNIILYLDSDCIATPTLLEEHMEKYRSKDIGAVSGPLEFIGNENNFWKAVKQTPYIICFKIPYWSEETLWGTTANFSIRKDVFLEINGFDETFPDKPGGEDVDLGLRIHKEGFKIATTKKGLVYHDKSTWSQRKQMYRRVWNYGCADFYLIDRHPEYTVNTMPRRCIIYALVSFFVVFQVFFFSPVYLLIIPIWIILDIFMTALNRYLFGQVKSTLKEQIEVQIMIIINELGFLKNCFKFHKINYLNKQMVYFENQIKGITYNGNISFWCFFIDLIFILFVFLILSFGR